MACLVQLADQLIEIITDAHELRMNEPEAEIPWFGLLRSADLFIDENGSPKMYGPHAERVRASLDVNELLFGEAQIKLVTARSGLSISCHLFPWQSACVLGFGDHSRPVPKFVFA
jgi:hypothetical protein